MHKEEDGKHPLTQSIPSMHHYQLSFKNHPRKSLRLLSAASALALAVSSVPSAWAQSAYYQAVTNLAPAAYWPLQETVQPPVGDIETNIGTLGQSANAVYSSSRVAKGTGGATADGDTAAAFLGNTTGYGALSGGFLAVPLTDPRVSVASSSFSVEAWVNAANYNGFVGIVCQAGGNPGGLNGTTNQAGWCLSGQYLPSFDSSNLRGFSFHVYNGQSATGNGAPRGGAEVVVPIGYSLNTWYHLVATFDGVNCSLYVNGTNLSSMGYRLPMPAGTSYVRDTWDPLLIGTSRNLNGNNYVGAIDEVAVYTNVLTAGQIQNHYNTGLNPSPSIPYPQVIANDNAYMYWRMNAPSYDAPDPSTYPAASYYSSGGVVMNVGSGTLANSVYGTASKPGMPGPQFPGLLDPSNGGHSYAAAINGIGGANGGNANINIGNGVTDVSAIPIDAGYNAALDPKAPPFSISIWFKGDPTDANGGQRFQNIVGHTDSGWRATMDTTGKVHFKPGNNGSEITSARVYNDGAWHHLVGTCTTTAENLYIDGVLDTTAGSATTFAGSLQDVMIGGDAQYLNSGGGTNNTIPANTNSYNQRNFAGSVAHFAFFTNALTGAQVTNLYQSVSAPPVVLGQPAGPRTQAGGTALSFGVVASGSAPISYQWYRTNAGGGTVMLADDNVKYVGSTSLQVTVSNLVDADSGTYFVVVSNNYGAVTSSVATTAGQLQVYSEPLITAQSPAGGTYKVGVGQTPQVFSASVIAATNGLTYQWYTNGTAIPGATATVLPLPAAQAANNGIVLSFVASNSFGAATNAPVTVSIVTLPALNTPYASNVLALAPQGYWPMHEVEAPYPIQDIETNYGSLGSFGNAYFGDWQVIESFNPSPVIKQQPGALANDPNPSIYFTGVNGSPSGGSYAIIPRTSPLTTIKAPFTLEAWVKPFNNTFGIIFGMGSLVANSGLNSGANEGGFDWLWAGSASTFSITVRNGNGTGSTEPKTTANYNPGNWYHVVTTYDGTNISYYINGAQDPLQNSSAATLNPNTWMPLTIGGGRWSGTINNQFQGLIDELAVYTNILSASDIQKHYDDGTTGAAGVYKADVIGNNPLLYYRMDSQAYAHVNTNNLAPLQNYGSAGVQGVYKPNAIPGGGVGPTASGFPIAGFPNTALTSDGNSIFADAGFDSSWNGGTNGNVPISVTAWFKFNPGDVQQRNWQTLMGHTDQSWRCAINGGTGAIGFDSGNGLDVRSTNTYNDGQWHQVVGTYDGANTLVYVDGKLQGSGNRTTTNQISPFDIYLASSPNGQSNAAGGRTIAGSICEAAFFSGKALTATDVSNLYNSAEVPVYVSSAPAVSGTVNQNSCYTNTIVVSGSTPISYQWYNGGTPLAGQTNASLIFCPATTNNASTNLYVVVSNPYGSITSAVSSLTVFSLPNFVVQPTNTTITNSISLYAGAHPTFRAFATGGQPIVYQWTTNNVAVTGATNISYTLPSLAQGNSITVACAASNFVGTATTAPLTINVQASPINPYPIAVTALNPLGYWRLNEPDDNIGDNNDSVLAQDHLGGINGIYTNANLGSAGYSSQTDPTETSASFGFSSSTNSDAGSIASSLTGTNFGLSSNVVYGIDFASPTNASTAFTVSAWVNAGPQTQDAGIVAKGVIFNEEFGLDTGADGGNPSHAFRFFVRTANGTAYNANSTNVPNANWHHLVGVCDEPNGALNIYVDGILAGSGTLPNVGGILASSGPMQIGARPGSADPNANTLQFVGSIDDVAVFNYALNALQVSNLYYSAGIAPSFLQDAPNAVNVNEHGTLTVKTVAVGSPQLFYQWYDLNSNAPLAGQTNATLVINNYPASLNGETFGLTVSNMYGSVSSASVYVSVLAGAPSIVTDLPTGPFTVAAGAPYPLSVTVQGTEPLTYTWYHNGSAVPGVNSNSYIATPAFGANQYYVSVVNVDGGPAVSQTLTLVGQVGTPPVTLPPSDSTGWTLDAQSAGPPVLADGVLKLTDGGGSESRQAWYNTKVDVSRFIAEFTYQDVTGGTAGADGITFCIQGTGTTAEGGGGGSLGVSGISPSLDFALNIYHGTTPPGPAAGWNLNGGVATTATAPLVLDNGSHPIRVVMYYDGAVATAWLTDATASNASPVYSQTVNLPALVGNPAYIGFTGATGGSVATQVVSNFFFATVTFPALSEHISGNNLVVNWPGATSSLYVLQSAPKAKGPWSDVTTGIGVSGNQAQYVTPLPNNAVFYRLILRIP